MGGRLVQAWECRRDWGGQGKQSQGAALPQPPLQGPESPSVFGVVGETQPLRSERSVGWRGAAGGRPLPLGDTAARGTGSSPRAQGFPAGAVAAAARRVSPRLLRLGRTPQEVERPRNGDHPWARGGHGTGGRQGSLGFALPSRPGAAAPGPTPPRTWGSRGAGAAPAELEDTPPADGRVPRSSRHLPRGPPPRRSPILGCSHEKFGDTEWPPGAARGSPGTRGSPGSTERRRGGETPGGGRGTGASWHRARGWARGRSRGGRAGCGGGCGRTYLLRRRLPALGGAPSPEAR